MTFWSGHATSVLLHERQHYGDLNTLLYQLGVEVPIVEYRFSPPERRRA